LACPYCAGRFQAEAAAESRAIACPGCGRMVTVPAAPRQAVPPPPPSALVDPLDVPPRSPFDLSEPTKVVVTRRGEAVPLRRLSPRERTRHRVWLNLAFAAIGMAILAVALAVLLRVRP